MFVVAISPIFFFELEGLDTLHLGKFAISNEQSVKEQICSNPNFIPLFGQISKDLIDANYIIFYRGNTEDEPVLKDLTHAGMVATMLLNAFSRLFRLLWYIKNNSCSVNVITVLTYDDYSYESTNTSHSQYDGKYVKSSFTKEEVEKAFKLDVKINKFYDATDIIEFKPEDHFVAKTYIRPNSGHNSKFTMNRIRRALLFLDIARSNTYPIMKISSGISLLESLFTIGNNELSFQVKIHPAIYLGKANFDHNYKIIDKAYSIRSSLVHGDMIDSEPIELDELNKELDIILRSILLKVLNDPDIFLKYTAPDEKDEYKKHWRQLANTEGITYETPTEKGVRIQKEKKAAKDAAADALK